MEFFSRTSHSFQQSLLAYIRSGQKSQLVSGIQLWTLLHQLWAMLWTKVFRKKKISLLIRNFAMRPLHHNPPRKESWQMVLAEVGLLVDCLSNDLTSDKLATNVFTSIRAKHFHSRKFIFAMMWHLSECNFSVWTMLPIFNLSKKFWLSVYWPVPSTNDLHEVFLLFNIGFLEWWVKL